MKCPCNPQKKYSLCCSRYHLGNLHPPTAEALMRSRYSACVLNKFNYIYETWHKETRPSLQSIRIIKTSKYLSLTVQTTDMGLESHDIGTVTFTAFYKDGTQLKEYSEVSSFKREDTKWVYFKGQPV